MTDEEIIAQFREQGLRMEPENDGESVDVLCETLEALCKDFKPITLPDHRD